MDEGDSPSWFVAKNNSKRRSSKFTGCGGSGISKKVSLVDLLKTNENRETVNSSPCLHRMFAYFITTRGVI